MGKFKKEEVEGVEGHGERFGIAFGFAMEASEEMANATIHGLYGEGAGFAFLVESGRDDILIDGVIVRKDPLESLGLELAVDMGGSLLGAVGEEISKDPAEDATNHQPQPDSSFFWPTKVDNSSISICKGGSAGETVGNFSPYRFTQLITVV